MKTRVLTLACDACGKEISQPVDHAVKLPCQALRLAIHSGWLYRTRRHVCNMCRKKGWQ